MMPSAPLSRVQHHNKAPLESPDCVRSDLATVSQERSTQMTQVIRLPWTDSRGIDGYYTGEINALAQPHGMGILRFGDGTVISAKWCNGMPLRPTREADFAPLSIKPPFPEKQQTLAPSRALKLGDVGTRQDMCIEHDLKKAHANAASLQIHSFAFICRSNGEWTYAIVANRPIESGPEATIRFVVDEKGNTKIIQCKYWSTRIRLVKRAGHEGVEGEIKVSQDPEAFEKKLERMCLVPKSARRTEDSTLKDKVSSKLQNTADSNEDGKLASRKPARQTSVPVRTDKSEAAGNLAKGIMRSTSHKSLRRISWNMSSSMDELCESTSEYSRSDELQNPDVQAMLEGSAPSKPARRSSMPVSSDKLEAAGNMDKYIMRSTSSHEYMRRATCDMSSTRILDDRLSEKGAAQLSSFHRAYSSSVNLSSLDQSSMTVLDGPTYAKMSSFHMAARRVSADLFVRSSDSANRI